ncbi:MAG TPA: TetR family transcriptional regulator [Rhodanobacteraceae bacterium]
MTARRKPVVGARKQPRQARSAQLVDDILEAAIRVLVREGARRFTTARVAETAGISVGSLYQYFPNKEAILFRLQTREWRQTMDRLSAVLEDADTAPPTRLKTAVRLYFQSECEEVAFRGALEDAAPLYREAPEVQAHVEEGRRLMERFMDAALPQTAQPERAFVASVVGNVMSAVGHRVSGQGYSEADIDRFAAAVGEMLCAYVEGCAATGKA